ncbi:MAG: hypothetical protein C4526_06130 [Nitrospiraceae bacterium]|nr:MAG: hypothetical protein C4526_06130 [Nitrospiraceae bacterium]
MANKFSFTADKDLVIKINASCGKEACNNIAVSIEGRKVREIFPFLEKKIELVFKDGRVRHITGYKHTCVMGSTLSSDVELAPVKGRKGEVKEVTVALDNFLLECPLNRKLSYSDEKMIEIGKTASSLAHGVRNPLNAIKGAVVYLREKYGHEATLLEFSTIINDEINKLDNFISNFLSAAKGEMKPAPVLLDDILKRITAMIRPRAEMQKINITQDLSSLPHIDADYFQIEQALFNVVNNAVEAMPEGGVLEIRTSLKWEKDRDYAVIKISDTGEGIPREKLRRLGEIRGGTGKNDRGFGIFISREIIKSHNGKLLWESISGKGTTFKIYLPFSAKRQA